MVALEQNKLFNRLAADELQLLRGEVPEKQFRPGQEIFKEGDRGDGIYVVKEGLVQISGLVGPNVRHNFSQVGPGDFFGEMAVLEDKPRSASAVAVGETVLYFIPRELMLKLVERSPQLSLNLLREISARLREFDRQYIREVLQTERLAVIGRFAHSIIHDLKTPLSIIGLSAEMAVMETCSAESRDKANLYIRRQVERINDMVNEILEFTQGSPSAFTLAAMDYAPYVKYVVKEITSEIRIQSVTIEMENEPPSARLKLNPRRLRHVFHNLIHNAVEAMPQGGKISIRFQAQPAEIVTEIQDSGAGIAPEIAGQLFEPFATHG
jgi:signal transduction histidine kinase